MLKKNLGFATICLGAMTGDSEKLWIPMAIIIIGIFLIFHGKEK